METEQLNNNAVKQLNRKEWFFVLVARMRRLQKEYFATSKLIKSEKDEGKIKKLRVKQHNLYLKSTEVEKLIDMEIVRVDEIYTKQQLNKFWIEDGKYFN